ncbi:diguanylate cyclase [Butyrivibrio fibrisolvens]|uniref:sensor domain-containing diguanylate cyclase n=1 Tax=Butyrivibrio fibrisolvens TaxID=831 RepID=UPI0003FDB8F3|nr:diguanylate cyclase [Butyrivibrio fibrisolvens]
MKQYTYVINDDISLEDVAKQISDKIHRNPHVTSVLQVIESSGTEEIIRYGYEKASKWFPDMIIYGMTSQGAIVDGMHDVTIDYNGMGICSLLLFENSTVVAKGYDCHIQTPLECGQDYLNLLNKRKDIKGILLMSSDITLFSEDFARTVLEEYPDVPIFGAMAGTRDVTNDRSMVYFDKEIYNKGIVAVAFCGDDLHIETKKSLGWRPLGKEFVITKSSNDGLVQEIDDKPAIDVYKEYLGVSENRFFYDNTAAFPILFLQNDELVGRVALYCSDGAIKYTMPIPEGTKASFAYARKKYLLSESLQNANDLISFNPQAILIYSCVTRRNFMGDLLADREFLYYKNVCSNSAFTGGYGEFLFSDEGAGLLNGTLIAIGFREGDATLSYIEPYVDEDLIQNEELLPLMERMINLLEKTTDDLRENVLQLYHSANHDELTGIYNRASFNYYYNEIFEKNNGPISAGLFLIDIDHFKHINDTYGHEAGDLVLKKLVAYVNSVLPERAVFCRWGGEEFVCIIDNIDKEEAISIAEHIRHTIETSDFSPIPKITISLGVTVISDTETSHKDIFKKVDDALYEAKESGRNKVKFRT